MAATAVEPVHTDARTADPELEPSPEAAAARIAGLRDRIDEIDETIMALWLERSALSQEVGATRVASGGTRLVLAREREILERYRARLGADGTQLALLVLRAGRGPL
ncbi:MAG TPA: chorismate mutase [Micromonosporaceae bacterium]|nr:chorismate mutase [Micromonosporaceae bacterium]